MDHNLSKAAEQGNVSVLYAAISSDPFILHNLDKIPFFDTPLHIAALVGQTDFALEIMMLKPSLGKKLNQNGYSPIHLAVINGHEKLVRGLLAIDKDLVRVKGKEGKTPLHCLSILEGYPSLLGEMISACPDSIEDLTLKRETALHLAVKNNEQTLSFKILVKAVKKFHKEEIYRWQDEDGNTVLHCAIISIQLEMIQLLFQKYKFKEWKLGVAVKDNNGHTAVDILDNFLATHVRRDSMRDILSLGTLQGIVTPRVNEGMWICNRCWGYIFDQVSLKVQKVPRDSRDALLVVLALVNTTSFQAGVNPPGGFWQNDGVTCNGKKYAAGTPILATTSPAFYFAISLFTMAGFISSFNLIVVLTVGMPMKYLLILAMIFLSYSYLFAFTAITRKLLWMVQTIYGVVTLFFGIIIVMYLRKYIKRYYQRGRGE